MPHPLRNAQRQIAFARQLVLVLGLLACGPGIRSAAAQGWASPPLPAGPQLPAPGNIPEEVIVPDVGSLPLSEDFKAAIQQSLPVINPVQWDRSLELGVSGSEGNAQVFNLRTAGHLERKSDLQKSTLDITYRKSEASGTETANLLFAEGRNEWIFPDKSPWSIYIHGTAEYDEFRDYNARVAADSGLGYYFVRNDLTSLQGRAGGGFSHEIGGFDESYVPEGVFGMEASHQLTPRSKLTAKSDYYPDLSDPSDFRLNSSANWEVLMDDVLDISLKFGLIDRYDSTPGTKKANDLDYSVVLLWKF